MLLLVVLAGCAGRSRRSDPGSQPPKTTPGAPTLTLAVNPSTITAGQSATLAWSSTNATGVTIDNGIGPEPPSGSLTVSPSATSTYSATAAGANGQATAQATLTVNRAPGTGFQHVALVIEENHSFSQIVGSSQMPFLNALIKSNGLATQYFANFHPSLPNYFELTVGQRIAQDDGFTGVVPADDDDIVKELELAGKTWKVYADALPSVGWLGGDRYPYTQHHNPFTYFSEVRNSSNQQQNLVPATQLAADISANQLPNFLFILPDELDDAHDGTLQQADQWLQATVGPLLGSAAFQQGGLLIVTFDESLSSDAQNGGGRVATVIISSKAKPGFQSVTLYQHQSTLRLILKALGATGLPGDSASAPDMTEFFEP